MREKILIFYFKYVSASASYAASCPLPNSHFFNLFDLSFIREYNTKTNLITSGTIMMSLLS